jgi:hypothetical protein
MLARRALDPLNLARPAGAQNELRKGKKKEAPLEST